MRTHLIIDFMHLVFRAKSVKTYLSTPVKSVRKTDTDGVYAVSILGKEFEYTGSETGTNKLGEPTALSSVSTNPMLHTTTVYFVLRYIEQAVKEFQKDGEVAVTICLDSKGNQRKEENADYKANRNSGFLDDDHRNVQLIGHILKEAGYNILKVDTYEADDLIYAANKKYSSEFDRTVIMTNDMDLVANIGKNTELYIRRQKDKAYKIVSYQTADELCAEVYKVDMPYQAITLFKSTVGDTSDGIKGVNRFGAAAFQTLINKVRQAGIQSDSLSDYSVVEEIIVNMLKPEQKAQAIEALGLVKPREVDDELITEPKVIDEAHKKEVYGVLGIKSL